MLQFECFGTVCNVRAQVLDTLGSAYMYDDTRRRCAGLAVFKRQPYRIWLDHYILKKIKSLDSSASHWILASSSHLTLHSQFRWHNLGQESAVRRKVVSSPCRQPYIDTVLSTKPSVLSNITTYFSIVCRANPRHLASICESLYI